MKYKHLFFLLFAHQTLCAQLPETGISGVYEVMLATATPQYDIRYFGEFGFSVVDSAVLTADQAFEVYGVRTALTSYRLQNGDIDSHGLLRLLCWQRPLGNGVGYSAPETVGRRMARQFPVRCKSNLTAGLFFVSRFSMICQAAPSGPTKVNCRSPNSFF